MEAAPLIVPAAEPRRVTVVTSVFFAVVLFGAAALSLSNNSASLFGTAAKTEAAATVAPTWYSPLVHCADEEDCGLAGACVQGRCDCDAAWTGPTCTALAVLPTPENSGLRRPDQASWGGSVIKSGGTYHMYFEDFMNGCGVDQWQKNSQITHAISSNPIGPYHVQEVVQKAFAHNPTVHHLGGKYVIYHIGHAKDKLTSSDRQKGKVMMVTNKIEDAETCHLDYSHMFRDARTDTVDDPMRMLEEPADEPENPVKWDSGDLLIDDPADNSNLDPDGVPYKNAPAALAADEHSSPLLTVGMIVKTNMMVADSPNGPWKLQESKMPETERHAPGMCNNPAVVEDKQGSVLMFCKTNDHGRQAIFRAPGWQGPFHFVKYLHTGISGEDLNVWYSKKRDAFHMLYHRFRPHHASTAWSKDGLTWHFLTKPHTVYDHSIKLDTGKLVNVGNRERHHVLTDEDGEPIALFNGVTIGDKVSGNPSSRYTYTAAVPIRTTKDHKLPSDNSERLKKKGKKWS